LHTLCPDQSLFLIIDLQTRLLPAIHKGTEIIATTKKVQTAAELLDIPVLFTEQNPAGLGHTTPDLTIRGPGQLITKMTFDSCLADGFKTAIRDHQQIVVAGTEAHVCVLQTVLGLLEMSKQVYVLEDAVSSRTPANGKAALSRMEKHGAEIVTSEMVLFEWLQTAENPNFRDVLKLIK